MSTPAISHRVRITEPASHRAQITMHVATGAEDTHTVVHLPVWTPGSYLVREFGRYLGPITATLADGSVVPVVALAKSSWRIDHPAGAEIELHYEAYAHELTVRTPHIDTTHAFFTGSNLLLWVDGRTAEPALLCVEPPTGWEVYTTLDDADDKARTYVAPNYDTLADTPVECGPHRCVSFDALGIPHRLIFWGDGAVTIDMERLTRDIHAIVVENAAIFGGLPYARYDFVFHITENARGGLEHLSSTVLATPWRYFDTEPGYVEMLGLIAHEHFHVWNVKRIKPAGLVPFDYLRENYTRALWVSEGFTSYFDDLVCHRAGLLDAGAYLEGLAKALTRYYATPGRLVDSVASASFNAWIRLYRPDEDTPNRTVSYYLKGALVALCIDLKIRSATNGSRTLDDVMRYLWERFGSGTVGFPEDGVAALIEAATGVDLRNALAVWVDGTDDPDFSTILASHGVVLSRETNKGAYTGVRYSGEGDVTVDHVERHSPASHADLSPGDVLVAIDGRRVGAASVAALLEALPTDRDVAVHVFRRGRLLSKTLRPTAPREGEVTLTLDAEPGPDVAALRSRWLNVDASQTQSSSAHTGDVAPSE